MADQEKRLSNVALYYFVTWYYLVLNRLYDDVNEGLQGFVVHFFHLFSFLLQHVKPARLVLKTKMEHGRPLEVLRATRFYLCPAQRDPTPFRRTHFLPPEAVLSAHSHRSPVCK